MLQLDSAIPDKVILTKAKAKTSILIKNLTRVERKLEKPENCPFFKVYFSSSTLDLSQYVTSNSVLQDQFSSFAKTIELPKHKRLMP